MGGMTVGIHESDGQRIVHWRYSASPPINHGVIRPANKTPRCDNPHGYAKPALPYSIGGSIRFSILGSPTPHAWMQPQTRPRSEVPHIYCPPLV